VYGALTAILKDIKRMVAYSSIGHMGYVLLGAAATQVSLVGAVAQMVAHGLILAMFHLVGVIETKVGTRDLDVLNGLMSPVRGLPLTSSLVLGNGWCWYPWYGRLYRRNLRYFKVLCHFSLTNTEFVLV